MEWKQWLQCYIRSRSWLFIFITFITPVRYHSDNFTAGAPIVQFPDLYPGVNPDNPWSQPYYRFRVSIGVVPDMVFTHKSDEPANPNLKFEPTQERY